ncbi:MAG: sigma-70 family RNA polymerase sigma factor [Lachnospiraceae bacterium]|nr:sigma-70 family RNA polymerase sigma factor [Lachnospiraceae bacterium]
MASESTDIGKNGIPDSSEIYSLYAPKVRGYIHGKIDNPEDAEDLLQDVFVKVVKNLDSFDSSKASLSTWIYVITANTVNDFFRTRKVSSELPEAILADVDIEDSYLSEEILQRLAGALEKLDPRERDVVVIHYYRGVELKAIAAHMNVSYSTVKNIHRNAIRRLKALMEG